MVKMGEYNMMKVIKEKSMGVFLDDGDEGFYYRNDLCLPVQKLAMN